MISKANLYQARVWDAYCAWGKTGKDKATLDSIAESFDVLPWDIELEHRIALDLC